MNFVKKMCILRQVKQGFSGDGKTLSGLIKIEQYGKNLSVEVSVINFAPLSSGEYYCLLADRKGRTEMLPLRGKSLFNIVSDLNAEDGFCGVICFVKNGISPHRLRRPTAKTSMTGAISSKIPLPRAERKRRFPAANERAPFNPFANDGDRAETSAPISYDVPPAPLYGYEAEDKKERPFPPRPAQETPDQPQETEPENGTIAPPEPPAAPTAKGKYERRNGGITENYYRKEEDNERFENEKSGTYAHAEGGNPQQAKKERANASKDGDAEDIRHPFETDPDGYYLAVKGEIDALFAKYPADDSLKGIFAYSEWVRVQGEEGAPKYLVGVIYDDLKAKYICYALPGGRTATARPRN